jgi:hypothetical protein
MTVMLTVPTTVSGLRRTLADCRDSAGVLYFTLRTSFLRGTKKAPVLFCRDIRRNPPAFTRLSDAFSKKLASHRHALSLYLTFYNWTRIHKTVHVTPAMAAGLADHLWTTEEIVGLMDEVAPKPGRPKAYKKRIPA